MRQREDTGAYALLWDFRDHLGKILALIITHCCVISRAITFEQSWMKIVGVHLIFNIDQVNVSREQHFRDSIVFFFFFRSNTRLTLIHDAKGRAYTRDRSLRPEYLSQVRCDRREKCKGIDDRETNERAGRIRTWRGATRLVAREELASRAPTQTHPTAPFQPTRPTEPPLQEQVPTLSLSLFHPRRRSHHPSTLDRPFGACIAIYPRIYPRPGSTLSGSRPTCSAPVERFIYMRLSPGFVLASNFITRWRVDTKNKMMR